YRVMLQMAKRVYDAGIPVLAGTDDLPGFTLPRELELEVLAGIPTNKALQIATYNAAKLLHREQDLGSIAPGKIADLLLVDGDPTRDIGDLRRSRLVVRGGVLYRSADVFAAVGVKSAMQ